MSSRLISGLALGVLVAIAGCTEPSAPRAERFDGGMADAKVASAMCGLVISQPGRYRLAGDIIGCTVNPAISIDADDVTLNLNGFTVSGSATFGIRIEATSDRAAIRGWGVVSGFVNAIQVLGPGASVSGIDVTGGGNAGIHFNAGADGGTVAKTLITGTRFAGLSVGANNMKVRLNQIAGHTNGMFFDPATSGHKLRDNSVTGASDRGVYFNASNSRIFRNTFTGNTNLDFENVQGCGANNRFFPANTAGTTDGLTCD